MILAHFRPAASIARAPAAVMLTYARFLALLAHVPLVVDTRICSIRSAAFFARALLALGGSDARPQAPLARAPDAVMFAYLQSPAFLAPAPAAVMLAHARSPAFPARVSAGASESWLAAFA